MPVAHSKARSLLERHGSAQVRRAGAAPWPSSARRPDGAGMPPGVRYGALGTRISSTSPQPSLVHEPAAVVTWPKKDVST